ncbi:acid-sensing ion channel 3-like [Panulirus ornatus]|uniref:acid-sensing ion channel 3-like n=1 Tax=Panulirus ornatus TaxID=150431 RepID=UPI003A8B4E66
MIGRHSSKITSMTPSYLAPPATEGVRLAQQRGSMTRMTDSWVPEVLQPSPPPAMVPENISVVGMRQVFSRGTRLAVRGFWSIILVSLFALFLTQVTNRVLYYLSNPVKVTTKIKRPSQLIFPTITLCYKSMFNPERTAPYKADAAEVLGLPESEVSLAHLMAVFNATELWRNTGYHLQDQLEECFFGRTQPCASRGRFIPLLTILGLCYKFVVDKGVTTSGPFNNFYIKLKIPPTQPGGERGWRLLVQNHHGNVALRVITSGRSVYPQWSPDVQVSMKKFHTLNTHSDPCVDRGNYSDLDCEVECFEKALTDGGGCWLPFMTQGSAKPCLSVEQHAKNLALLKKLTYGGKWSRSRCGCDAPCSDVTYEMNSDSRFHENNLTRIRIFYQDLSYQDVMEEWAYTLIPLVCDIGGVMGLLLGASVLTFIEVLECMLGCCYKGCRNHHTHLDNTTAIQPRK